MAEAATEFQIFYHTPRAPNGVYERSEATQDAAEAWLDVSPNIRLFGGHVRKVVTEIVLTRDPLPPS